MSDKTIDATLQKINDLPDARCKYCGCPATDGRASYTHSLADELSRTKAQLAAAVKYLIEIGNVLPDPTKATPPDTQIARFSHRVSRRALANIAKMEAE